jgi:hypothetical protein
VGGILEKMSFVQGAVLFDLIMQKEDNPSASVAASAIENIFHVTTKYIYLSYESKLLLFTSKTFGS